MASTAQRPSRPAQVAAVCFRRKGGAIEFLLVRTGRGRWSFPKGHMERTLSVRESAAREALEEAGAVGVIARRHFASYRHRKRACPSEVTVRAYLLEVMRTIEPPERHREPRWFGPQEARLRLAATRKAKYRKDLHTVVDRAVRLLTEARHRHLLP